jgi:class 3 adenylate cyclase
MLGGVCPGCGAVNPAQGRFCSQCGEALTAGPFAEAAPHPPLCQPEERRAFPRAAAGERKHVTVLFSDMSGYTALTQRLDPEEVREIMARLSHEITRVVARYEGFIEKFAGDAVMAVFGAIQAHEDDAIRAIIAAREIHERVAAYSRRYEEEIGQSLAMHSGINTGLVVTGDVGFEAGTHGIAGAPLNIASRLCALAGPGEILVGDQTYRHALGYFNFLALDPVAVKGVSVPVQIYRVVSLIDRPQKIHRFHGLRADLIGRSPELTTLAEALD